MSSRFDSLTPTTMSDVLGQRAKRIREQLELKSLIRRTVNAAVPASYERGRFYARNADELDPGTLLDFSDIEYVVGEALDLIDCVGAGGGERHHPTLYASRHRRPYY